MRFERSLISETCVAKPAVDLVDGIGASVFGVHKHVHSEKQSKRRSRSLVIHQELGNGDNTTRIESVEGFAQKSTAG